MNRVLSTLDRPVWIAFALTLAILCIGTVYTLTTTGTAPLLQPGYLLQQLQIGAFLGLCAMGMMLVILLGEIDLSLPWTLTAAAMVATAIGGPLAIPAALAVGLVVGLLNGFGVSVLRVPSMIFTLGMDTVLRGLMVAQTGGYAPQDQATPIMLWLAKGRVLGLPVALVLWVLLSIGMVFLLNRTVFGRALYAIGSKERAAYLSGIRTRRVVVAAFVLSSLCAAMAGVLLAGYSAKAYQGMGNAFLMPAIAAVVLGGTNILGGQGRYSGTLAGVILIVLLNSVLSIMQMPEAWRQIIYGLVIIGMLLIYRR
ncbi:ABC transporter permease [Neogemmobacter tilapiae]|uniref:ABC transporter permease n=1 Tax=Neogemmobacter tilapiae TaxID=875041 RepID=A0A918WKP4_9RHOB|nr:ABC transporter permease [Gemmobacter tilapiae]GHC60261.1 ABC transporter permease [Gemmobacter tilapiae]